jgi:transposase
MVVALRRRTGPASSSPGRRSASSSKTVTEVGREIGVNSETLRGWVKKHQKGSEPSPGADLTIHERARLKELERQNRELQMENTFLKKAAAYFAKDHH